VGIQPSVETKTQDVKAKRPVSTRTGLKHIGGYLDRETVEKVAILSARLGLDNSELIKLAVDDLHRKHLAKRALETHDCAWLQLCTTAYMQLI
jgi:hypothetical protein